jgi:hypothetical protein
MSDRRPELIGPEPLTQAENIGKRPSTVLPEVEYQ